MSNTETSLPSNVLVLGTSGSGKTPFAKLLAERLKAVHIGASGWVREMYKPSRQGLTRAEEIEELTALSKKKLKSNSHLSAEYIRSKMKWEQSHVIEGMRNAFDLPLLLDPRKDFVVFLSYTFNRLPTTDFERGLPIMRQQIQHLRQMGWMGSKQVVSYQLASFYEPKSFLWRPFKKLVRWRNRREVDCGCDIETYFVWSLEEALEHFQARFGQGLRAPLNSLPMVHGQETAMVHANMAPMDAHFRAEFAYNLDPAWKGKYLPCKVFAVSSYPGEPLTFQVCFTTGVEQGSVYAYVPAHALVDLLQPAGQPQLELADLIYHPSKTGRICVSRFAGLEGPLNACFRRTGTWLSGRYILTVDWYDGNDALNLVALENGQYAFLPYHKLKFQDGVREFPDFRKLKSSWSVEWSHQSVAGAESAQS